MNPSTSPPSSTPTTAEVAGAQTRERLLDVAERQFAARGFAQSSIRSITSEAGCNVSAVSYHFESKQGLYRACVERRLRALREGRIAGIEGGRVCPPEPSRLHALLHAFAEAFVAPFVDAEGGVVMSLLMRELLMPELPRDLIAREVFDPVNDRLADALVEACPGLERSAALLCTHSISAQLGHLVHAWNQNRLAAGGVIRRPTQPLDAIIDHIVRFSVAGVAHGNAHAARGEDL